jgi:hypothetical protein
MQPNEARIRADLDAVFTRKAAVDRQVVNLMSKQAEYVWAVTESLKAKMDLERELHRAEARAGTTPEELAELAIAIDRKDNTLIAAILLRDSGLEAITSAKAERSRVAAEINTLTHELMRITNPNQK